MITPDACDIEIIERTCDEARDGAHGLVIPNEIRINGKPVLAPSDHPVIVHELPISGGPKADVGVPVKVTLTLFARVVKVGHELIKETV